MCLRSDLFLSVCYSTPLLRPPPPPTLGDLWRLEDDIDCEDEPERGGSAEARPRSHSPFSHFRARAAYLRKSVSADDHLDFGSDFASGAGAQGKSGHGAKGKLKRKFVSLSLQFLYCYFFLPFMQRVSQCSQVLGTQLQLDNPITVQPSVLSQWSVCHSLLCESGKSF